MPPRRRRAVPVPQSAAARKAMLLMLREGQVDSTMLARELYGVEDLRPPRRRRGEGTRENGASNTTLVRVHTLMCGLLFAGIVTLSDRCCQHGSILYTLTSKGLASARRAQLRIVA